MFSVINEKVILLQTFLVVYISHCFCTSHALGLLQNLLLLVRRNVLNSFLIHFLLIRFFFSFKKSVDLGFFFLLTVWEVFILELIWASKSLTSILGSQKIKIKIWISMDLYESPKSAWEGESKSNKQINKQKTWKERSLFLIFIFGMILSCFLIANQRL